MAEVRDGGNEAGLPARGVDLPRAATAEVERTVSFPFPRCTPTEGGGNVLMSSSPLSVVESTVALPRVGGPGLRRAVLAADSSLEPLVSFCQKSKGLQVGGYGPLTGGLLTSRVREVGIS